VKNGDKQEIYRQILNQSRSLIQQLQVVSARYSGRSTLQFQRNDFTWRVDSNGNLPYAREVEKVKGTTYFWVTEDLKQESPVTLQELH